MKFLKREENASPRDQGKNRGKLTSHYREEGHPQAQGRGGRGLQPSPSRRTRHVGLDLSKGPFGKFKGEGNQNVWPERESVVQRESLATAPLIPLCKKAYTAFAREIVA